MITFVLLTILAIFILYQLWKYRSIRHLPGPPDLFFLVLLYRLSDKKNLLRTISDLTNKYGSIVKIALSPTDRILLITDREVTEFFLRSPKFIRKSFNYKYFFPWLGIDGILTAEGSKWQNLRKLWIPTFHLQMLEYYLPIFEASSNTFIQVLEKHVHKEEFDIYPYIASYTLDIILEAATGLKANTQTNPNNDFIHSVHFLTDNIMKRTVHVWKSFDFLYQFSNDTKVEQQCIKKLNDITDKSIIERRKLLLQDKKNKNESKFNEFKKNSIFMDDLLQSNINGEPLNNKDIHDAINVILFAGQDTTATTNSSIVYELANNLEVQNKLVEELKTIFGNDKDRPATASDLNRMKYMELVIKEVMRVYSPVPLIGRQLAEDVEYNGTILPKGLNLIFYIYGLHQSSELFDNPELFRPERFAEDSKIEPYSHIPFSAGPRNCIGQKFALNQMKVTLAKLLRHYELLSAGPEHKVQLSPEAVMKSLNGFIIKIKNRKF